MNRVAFEIPIPFLDKALPIHWYGLMIAVGFVLGYGIMLWRAKQIKFPAERVADIVFTAVLAGIVGARLLYVINYWNRDFAGKPFTTIFAIHRGGLVFYGGFIGGAVALIILARVKKLNLAVITDLCALGVPLAHTFGRIGCFLNGCCYGCVTTSAIGFRYPIKGVTEDGRILPYADILHHQIANGQLTAETVKYLEHTGEIPAGALTQMDTEGFYRFLQLVEPHYCLPVVPIQLFNSLRNILTFIVLLLICRRVKVPGQLAAIFLMLYGVGRFITEFWRGDYPELYLKLTSAQWICIVVIPFGAWLYYWLGRRRQEPPTAEDES